MFKVRYTPALPGTQEVEPRSSRPTLEMWRSFLSERKKRNLKSQALCNCLRRGVSNLISIMSSWYMAQSFGVRSLSCRQGMQTTLPARNNWQAGLLKTQERSGTIRFSMLLLLSLGSYLNSSRKTYLGFVFKLFLSQQGQANACIPRDV